MSEPSAFGFGQFVPGFDFLQNLSKTASQAQPAAGAGMPGMASWVAPTLNVEDIDKRIQELKSVLFWLEQNTTALKATIQAMEVQKMTLTTLQSMNVNMADLAKAFTVKPPMAEPAAAPAQAAAASAPRPSLFTPKPAPQPEPAPAAQSEPTPAPSSAEQPDASDTAGEAAKPAVDPMQWWGALTQQFQGIAAAALKDVAGEAMKAGQSAKAVKATKTAKAAGKTASSARRAQSPTSAAETAKRSATTKAPVKSARVASAPKPVAAASRRSTSKTASK
jgi:hypothetical protein